MGTGCYRSISPVSVRHQRAERAAAAERSRHIASGRGHADHVMRKWRGRDVPVRRAADIQNGGGGRRRIDRKFPLPVDERRPVSNEGATAVCVDEMWNVDCCCLSGGGGGGRRCRVHLYSSVTAADDVVEMMMMVVGVVYGAGQ